MDKKLFSIEDSKQYVGYSDGSLFKGYEMPLFTKEVAEQIITDFNCGFWHEATECFFTYRDTTDGKVVSHSREILQLVIDEVLDYEVPTTVMIDNVATTLYRIGGGSWIWQATEQLYRVYWMDTDNKITSVDSGWPESYVDNELDGRFEGCGTYLMPDGYTMIVTLNDEYMED